MTPITQEAGCEFEIMQRFDALSPAGVMGLNVLQNVGYRRTLQPGMLGFTFLGQSQLNIAAAVYAAWNPSTNLVSTSAAAATSGVPAYQFNSVDAWVDMRAAMRRAAATTIDVSSAPGALTIEQKNSQILDVVGTPNGIRTLSFAESGIWIVRNRVSATYAVRCDASSAEIPAGQIGVYINNGAFELVARSRDAIDKMTLLVDVSGLKNRNYLGVNTAATGVTGLNPAMPSTATALSLATTALAATHAGTVLYNSTSGARAITVNTTIPVGRSVDFWRTSTGALTFTASGVTIRKKAAKPLSIISGGKATLLRISTTEYVLFGDLGA